MITLRSTGMALLAWSMLGLPLSGCGGGDPAALPVAAPAGGESGSAVDGGARIGQPVAWAPADSRTASGEAPDRQLGPDELAERAVRDLGLVDADPAVRIATASGDAGALDLDQLQMAMLDPSPSVRMAALESLARPCEPDRMAPLRESLDDPMVSVREAAVEVLAACRHPRAISLLLQARGDASPIVREAAAEALYRLTGRVDGDD